VYKRQPIANVFVEGLEEMIDGVNRLVDLLPFIKTFWTKVGMEAKLSFKIITRTLQFEVEAFFEAVDKIADKVDKKIRGASVDVVPDLVKRLQARFGVEDKPSAGLPTLLTASEKYHKDLSAMLADHKKAIDELNKSYAKNKQGVSAHVDNAQKSATMIEKLREATAGFGDTVSASFAQAITYGEKLENVLNNLALQFEQMLLQRAFQQIIAAGNPFASGAAVPTSSGLGSPVGAPMTGAGAAAATTINITAMDSQDVYRALTSDPNLMPGVNAGGGDFK